jgi:hypothetical protein
VCGEVVEEMGEMDAMCWNLCAPDITRRVPCLGGRGGRWGGRWR